MAIHCEKCNKDFTSDEALNQHNKSKHPEKYKEPASPMRKKSMGRWVVALIILSIAVFGITTLTKDDNQEETLTLPKGPIHWHPKLTIIIDDVKQTIPPNIGLNSPVHSPIHTHEEDAAEGVIHMELDRPTKQNVILGYFFNVWKKKFSKDCIFDYCTDKGTLKMTVNGKENFDYENDFMHDKDEIVIEYVPDTVQDR